MGVLSQADANLTRPIFAASESDLDLLHLNLTRLRSWVVCVDRIQSEPEFTKLVPKNFGSGSGSGHRVGSILLGPQPAVTSAENSREKRRKLEEERKGKRSRKNPKKLEKG